MIGKHFSDDNVLYHWDILAWDNYVDWEQAHALYERIKKVNKKENFVSYSTFGETRTIQLPEANKEVIEKWDCCNEDFYSEVVSMMNENIISDDRLLVFWKRFFQSYNLYDYKNCLYISKKDKEETSIQIDDIVWESTEEDAPDAIPTGFKKEFIEWFYRTDPLIIMGTEQQIAETKEYTDGKVHGVYMDKIRHMAFKDFSEYSDKMDRPMSNAQYDMNYIPWQETWLAWARKVGKTASVICRSRGYWYSYRKTKRPLRIARLTLSEEALKSWRMYMKSQASNMFDLGSIDETKTDNTFYMNDVYLQQTGKKQKEVKKTIAEIEMKYISSGKMKNKVDLGWVYDLIIVDEAELISPEYYRWLMSLVKQDWSQIIFMMNFNVEGKKNFAYDKFIEAEKEEINRQMRGETVKQVVDDIRDKYKLWQYNSLEELLNEVDMNEVKRELMNARPLVGKRYSIWDNDMLTMEEKIRITEYFKKEDYITYLTHYECVMPNEQSIFDLSNIRKKVWENETFELVFVIYDPSKNSSDPSWLGVYWYRWAMWWPFYNSIVWLEEMEIEGNTIKKQIPKIGIEFDRVMNRYLHPGKDIKSSYVFLYDPNGIGESVREYLKAIDIKRVFWIHVVGDGDVEVEDEMVYRINKPEFISSLSSGIKDWLINIDTTMVKTFHQLTKLKELKTATGKVTYWAPPWEHDEFVSIAGMVNWFAYKKWIKQRFLIDKVKEIRVDVDNLSKEENPLERERKKQKEEKMKIQMQSMKEKKKRYYKKHIY